MKSRPTPLEGIRILDLSRLAPGPFGSMILADMGAEVIKVEEMEERGGNGSEHIYSTISHAGAGGKSLGAGHPRQKQEEHRP